MLHTDRNNFGISQADGETDDYNSTRLANNANFQELDKNTAKCNWEATSDPTVNDDSSLGYSEGSVWHNITDDKRFILKDATDGHAVWWQTYPMVGPTPAAANNLAKLGATGDIQDSEVNVTDIARRASTPTAGNVAGIDADGDPTDSGETIADLAEAIDKMHAAAEDDNFASLSEKTTPTGSMKVPVNDGTYGFMTRQNFLLGVKGGINFITNSDFEGDTVGQVPAGWGTYKDAALTTPVDGTGGSPSITFLASNSVILNGNKSARITKPASNCLGEGVNFLFNVPIAYRAGIVRIQLPYVPVDTIATGDFTIWIYDVTNGVLIQPAAYLVEGRTAGTPGAVVAEFQAPYNMAQGRLLWHVATTSASQLRVDVDEIQVGPGVVQNSGINLDWQAYTPNVFEGSNNKNTDFATRSAIWKRIGDTIFVNGYLQGTASSRSGTGGFSVSLPPGVIADVTSPVRGYNNDRAFVIVSGVASGSILDISFSGNCTHGSNYIAAINMSVGPISYNEATLNPASCEIYFSGCIKVIGWGSNCVMSSDAETRSVEADYNVLASVQTLTQNVYNLVNFDNRNRDTHGAVATGISWKFTAPIPGLYDISGQLRKNSGTAECFIRLFKNGAQGAILFDGLLSNSPTMPFQEKLYLNAGDYIDLRCYPDGAAVAIYNSIDSSIKIHRISGPSQIAASEKVYSEYSSDAVQAVADSSLVILNYEDKVEDSHGSVVVGASWKFVAPRPGVVEYSAQCLVPATGFNGSSEYVNMVAHKNGVAVKYEYMTPPAGAACVTPKIAGTIKVAAGDYIHFAIYQTSGGTINLSSNSLYNKVSCLMN